jgi:hypothetical protein
MSRQLIQCGLRQAGMFIFPYPLPDLFCGTDSYAATEVTETARYSGRNRAVYFLQILNKPLFRAT